MKINLYFMKLSTKILCCKIFKCDFKWTSNLYWTSVARGGILAQYKDSPGRRQQQPAFLRYDSFWSNQLLNGEILRGPLRPRPTIGPNGKKPLKKVDWLIIVIPATFWQILNMKFICLPETEMLETCQQTNWLYLWRVSGSWNHCAASAFHQVRCGIHQRTKAYFPPLDGPRNESTESLLCISVDWGPNLCSLDTS